MNVITSVFKIISKKIVNLIMWEITILLLLNM